MPEEVTSMVSRLASCLCLGCIFVGCLAAADDPFVGKWNFNSAQSKLTGTRQVIQDLGGNKYKLTFGTDSITIVADGTDQSVKYGGTLSFKQSGPNTWTSVHKIDGKVESTSTGTLSNDGQTWTATTSGTRPDGSTYTGEFKSKRVGGGKSLFGTWESTESQADSYPQWDIEPYDTDGLSFTTPSYKEKQDMKFDGKYYPDNGPNVAPGSTSSAKRMNRITIEWTDKLKEQVMDHQELKVSEDGKTLTVFIRYPGEKAPQTLVYDRL
jgi:hypothetical protein